MDKIEIRFKNSYNFYKIAVEILTYSQIHYRMAAMTIMEKYIDLELECVNTEYFEKEDMMDAIVDLDACKNGMTWTAASWILEKYIQKMEFFCKKFNYPVYEIETEVEYDTDNISELDTELNSDDDSDNESDLESEFDNNMDDDIQFEENNM
jgi:hypothetical protein